MSSPKLNENIKKAISQLVEVNYSLSVAAQKIGIAKSTASLWYKWGSESEKGKYRQFYEAINEAKDIAEQRLLDHAYSLVEEGSQVTREKIVYHPDGGESRTTETQNSQDFAVIRWLLEKRHGYDNAPEKAMEKAVNRFLNLSRKQLPEELFLQLVGAIADDPVLGDVDFDKDLMINN